MLFRGKKKQGETGEIVASAGLDASASTKNSKPKAKKKSRKKRIILLVVLVLVIVGALVGWKVLRGGEPAPMVSTGSVEVMDVEEAVTIKGTIEGSASADVASSLSYEVTSILVKEGDVVAKDQLLATLDDEDLQKEYQKAARTLADSTFAYESSKQLYEQGAISEKEYLNAKHAYESDRISLSAYDVSDKTNIRSPIAGTVTRVNVNLGQYANDMQDTEPMFVIENLENLKMDVKISEYDISKIKLGQKVTITAEMLGDQEVEGVVSQISPTGELKSSSSTEMVIPVEISVIKGDTNLIAGVTAKARIQIQEKKNVLSVPIDSVLDDPQSGESYVLVLNGTVLKKVTIDLGVEGDFNIEVASGDLKEGDLVVLSPTFDLADGMEVLSVPQ